MQPCTWRWYQNWQWVCKRGDRLRRGVPTPPPPPHYPPELIWWSCSSEDIIYHLLLCQLQLEKLYPHEIHVKRVIFMQSHLFHLDISVFIAVIWSVRLEASSNLIYTQLWPSLWDDAPLFIIIWNMKTGGAARCIHILCSTAIIKLGSIGRIVRSQLVVPSISDLQIFVNNRRYGTTI